MGRPGYDNSTADGGFGGDGGNDASTTDGSSIGWSQNGQQPGDTEYRGD